MKKLFYISTLLLLCLLLYSCDTNDNGLETTVAEQTVTAEETTVAEETTDSLTSITPEETSSVETTTEGTTIAETAVEETTAEETTISLDNYDIYCTSHLYNHYTIGFSRASEGKYLKEPIKQSEILIADVVDTEYIEHIADIMETLFLEASVGYFQEQKEDYYSLVWPEGAEIPEFEYTFELIEVKVNDGAFLHYTRDGSFTIGGSIYYKYHDNWLYYNENPDEIYRSSFTFVDNTKNINDLNP